MRKALVTGSHGFLGRNMVRRLEALGYNVRCVDIKSSQPGEARAFFRTDDTRYDLVVHAAAVVGGRVMIEREPLQVAVDLAIDAEFFQWALRTKPAHSVYFSSSAAYPIDLQKGEPYRLREDDIDLDSERPGTPDAVYGWVKLTGELQARLVEEQGVRVHVFRPFSGYGSDQDLTYPFPSFIARGLWRDDPFKVWGDGEQVRDFVHVDDVVSTILTAVEQDVPGVLNICSGRATTFNDLAHLVMKEVGYSAEIRHVGDAPVGVSYRVGDPERQLQVYRPRISLEEGIARALKEMA